jgi:glc operon protein GlcG
VKIRIALMAAAAATLFAGVGLAQTLNDVVIHGPMADRIREKNELSVVVAEKIAKHCIDEAASKNMSVSVALVDQFGTIIYYYRADGQAKGATESALKKALTAWSTRNPSHALQNQVALNPAAAATQFIQGNFPVAGGLPIVVENQFLGAIGVGGMAAMPPTWSDEICGWNALTAVLGPQPALLPIVPNRAPLPPATPDPAAGGGGRGAPNQ